MPTEHNIIPEGQSYKTLAIWGVWRTTNSTVTPTHRGKNIPLGFFKAVFQPNLPETSDVVYLSGIVNTIFCVVPIRLWHFGFAQVKSQRDTGTWLWDKYNGQKRESKAVGGTESRKFPEAAISTLPSFAPSIGFENSSSGKYIMIPVSIQTREPSCGPCERSIHANRGRLSVERGRGQRVVGKEDRSSAGPGRGHPIRDSPSLWTVTCDISQLHLRA
ncbi:hypothetical protein B0H13DRAFT_1882229 [Mycena leptocephala]|nr:hypothetical protein B0H13DRAFT_1882229 [Mycena leptocephala]